MLFAMIVRNRPTTHHRFLVTFAAITMLSCRSQDPSERSDSSTGSDHSAEQPTKTNRRSSIHFNVAGQGTSKLLQSVTATPGGTDAQTTAFARKPSLDRPSRISKPRECKCFRPSAHGPSVRFQDLQGCRYPAVAST